MNNTRFTPENIDHLEPNEVFVYGSNLLGINGAGAALYAKQHFGAKNGIGEGLNGQGYAFPTKGYSIETLPLKEIKYSVIMLLETCLLYPNKTFLCTLLGCGYAGYTPNDIAPLFKEELPLPINLVLPKEFHDIIYANT